MSAPVYQCIYDCPRPCMARHVVLEICSCVAIAMPMHDVGLAWLCTWSVLQNVSTNDIVYSILLWPQNTRTGEGGS